MGDIVFKFDIGETVYFAVSKEEACPGTRFKSFSVLFLTHAHDHNFYFVGNEWIEESFLLSEEEQTAIAATLAEEEQECLQQKLDDLG